MSFITTPIKYLHLASDLRKFLGESITFEQSKQVISERLYNRSASFLNVVKKGIYENPRSPYLKLLKLAGCEYGDIESLAARDGIEETLRKLFEEGVYISWEEFKGKRDVVRGGSSFQLKETDFDNPFLDGHFQARSSGSRSAGTTTMFDLKHLLERGYYILPMLTVNNAMDVPMGLWQAGLPSGAGIVPLLYYRTVGKPIARWFLPVTEAQTQASLRDKLANRYIIYGSRLFGARLAKPQYVPLSKAVEVAKWMADTKREFGGCSLTCFVSPAIAVCQAAMENGLDIEGTHFFTGGEPLTGAKRRIIESAGALVTPRYTISEISIIGFGCPGGTATDDVHLLQDSVALIQRRRKVEHIDAHVNSFLFTGLLSTSPKILLNVESDDYGVVEDGTCGCLFEQLGLKVHINNIRSFSKLTGSGMTIMGSDFIRILEEVLPQKYGGSPTDYQLLEEEDDRGQTQLHLIISPVVPEINASDVIETVLRELRDGAYGGKLAAGFWSQVNTIQVKRAYPTSLSGKITPLHLAKTGQ